MGLEHHRRLNLLLKLANHHNIEENGFYADVVTPTTKAIAGEVLDGVVAFSADLFLARSEAALAARLNLDGRDVSKMLTALERFPSMTMEGLQALCKPSRPIEPGQRVPAIFTAEGQAQGKVSKPAERVSAHDRSSSTEQLAPDAATGTEGDPISLANTALPNPPLEKAPASSDPSDIQGFKTLIQRLLISAGLGSCYEPAPNMPIGYYMGFPKDGPIDLKENAQSRQAAWWVWR